ncbi:MAG: hypothetical protein ABFR50_12025, partial [Candidatus Fermentibacteria bacterium]
PCWCNGGNSRGKCSVIYHRSTTSTRATGNVYIERLFIPRYSSSNTAPTSILSVSDYNGFPVTAFYFSV